MDGRTDERTDGQKDGRMGSDINATSGPKLSTDDQFISVELVSWGQMFQKENIFWQGFQTKEGLFHQIENGYD